MKPRIIIPIFFLVISSSAYSQKTIADFMVVTKELKVYYESLVDRDDFTGNPFITKEFNEGTILTSEGIEYEGIPLRYNIYNENFEFEKEGKPYELDPLKYGKKVSCNDQIFIYIAHYYNKNPKTGYLEVLEGGNFSVYKKYKVRYDRPEPAGAYSDSKPGNFIRVAPDYFFQYGEKGEIRFFGKESEFLDLCGIHRDNVKIYMKENKLKTRKEEDLIEIVKFLNSL